MPIIKTLAKAKKLEKEKFKIPRSVQEAIPIQRVWEDGIFQLGNRFSKAFSFTDINYAIAGKEDKTALFLDYSELLNALDSGASAKITIHNRRVNKADFEKSILLPMKGDSLDHFRQEYNQMLLSKVTGVSNSIVRERSITVTVAKRSIDEARVYFARVGTDLLTPTDEAVRKIQNKLLGVMTNKLLHTDMPCSPPRKICSSKGRPYSIIFPAIITGLMAGTNLSYRLCQMNRGGMWGPA